MSSSANAAKWTGKLLLHISLFFTFWMLASGLIHGAPGILPESEADMLERLFAQHFLVISILAGLATGLFIRDLCHQTGLLTASPHPSNSGLWREPQAWVGIVFLCIFLLGIVLWVEENRNKSVFAASSGITTSGLINSFYGSSCTLPTSKPTYFPGNCLYETLFTNTLLGAVGYSAANFMPTGLFSHFRKSPPQPSTGDNEVTFDMDQPSGKEPRHNSL